MPQFFQQKRVGEGRHERGLLVVGGAAVAAFDVFVVEHVVALLFHFRDHFAGVARMDAWKFFVMNVLGALPWAVGVTLLGYALGKSIHNVDRYLLPIIGVIVVVSFVPVVLELLRARRRAAAEPR